MNGELPATDVGGINPFAVLMPVIFGRGPGRLPTHPVTGEVGRLLPIAMPGRHYDGRALRGVRRNEGALRAMHRISGYERGGAAETLQSGWAAYVAARRGPHTLQLRLIVSLACLLACFVPYAFGIDPRRHLQRCIRRRCYCVP